MKHRLIYVFWVAVIIGFPPIVSGVSNPMQLNEDNKWFNSQQIFAITKEANNDLQESLKQTDDEPPVIIIDPITKHPAGKSLRIKAQIRGRSHITKVLLYYRNEGEAAFQPLRMQERGERQYEVSLLSEFIKGDTVDYFILAQDEAENTGYAGSLQEPYQVKIEIIPKKKSWYRKCAEGLLQMLWFWGEGTHDL